MSRPPLRPVLLWPVKFRDAQQKAFVMRVLGDYAKEQEVTLSDLFERWAKQLITDGNVKITPAPARPPSARGMRIASDGSAGGRAVSGNGRKQKRSGTNERVASSDETEIQRFVQENGWDNR